MELSSGDSFGRQMREYVARRSRSLISFPGEMNTPYAARDGPLIAAAEAWVEQYASLRAITRLDHRPLVSVLMPVFNTRLDYLQEAIESVLAQTYRNWELCLVDDGSTAPEVAALVQDSPARDPRIRAVRLPENRGIAAATNAALELATGELIGMLDHDDVLFPGALAEVVDRFESESPPDAVYTDQCSIGAEGRIGEAFHKPDWSPVLFCGVMYVGHFLVLRRSLALASGGFDSAFDNVQDFEFMLRVSERTGEIAHVRKVLYGWRRAPDSVASRGTAKPNIDALQATAVSAHLKRRRVPATAVPNPRHSHRAMLRPDDIAPPRVAAVVEIGEEEDAVSDALVSLRAWAGEIDVIFDVWREATAALGTVRCSPWPMRSRPRSTRMRAWSSSSKAAFVSKRARGNT